MISQIKQNRYQRRRLFHEDNESTATSFQRIVLRSDEQKNKNNLLILQTSKRRAEQMMCTLSCDLNDNGASPGIFVRSSQASRSNSTSEENHDDFGMQQEEPSIIQMIDQILSKHDSTKKEKDM